MGLHMQYEAVIGLEVHAQLTTGSKIFCSCSTRFGKDANTQTCPVCLGMPGALPVLNRTVVEYALRTALATNCRINLFNQFARKNYFYPDLPKGYQISQYELPISEHGHIDIDLPGETQTKRIGIHRIHIEEDAGKLMHELDGTVSDSSFVDYNRTGVPLIEIVSEPDMKSPDEAGEYLRTLRAIVQYLEVCDGNMEQGSFRCDANVSVMVKGAAKFGTKVELKNMNSFRNVTKALEYEISRQTALIEDGETIVQETRLWDDSRSRTISMRGKEEAHDYRYFPDPDLVPVVIDDSWIEKVRGSLPELPRTKIDRFVDQYSIPKYDAAIIASSRTLADYFERCVSRHNNPKAASNWIMTGILRHLDDVNAVDRFSVTPSHLAAMIQLIDSGTISGKIAKTVFEEMVSSGKMPQVIVEEKGLIQVSDEAEIEKTVISVIDEHPGEAQAYRDGKDKLLGFFVGQIMKKTKGKANPKMANDLLRKHLGR